MSQFVIAAYTHRPGDHKVRRSTLQLCGPHFTPHYGEKPNNIRQRSHVTSSRQSLLTRCLRQVEQWTCLVGSSRPRLHRCCRRSRRCCCRPARAALCVLPRASCIMAVKSAEAVASAVLLKPLSYPAPLVHDLGALRRWTGCDSTTLRHACIAAVQMLLLEGCRAMVGSFSR